MVLMEAQTMDLPVLTLASISVSGASDINPPIAIHNLAGALTTDGII